MNTTTLILIIAVVILTILLIISLIGVYALYVQKKAWMESYQREKKTKTGLMNANLEKMKKEAGI